MKRIETDFSGKIFGTWTVQDETPRKIGDQRKLTCRCECGKISNVSLNHLIRGNSKNCGCKRPQRTMELRKTHGMSETVEYATWSRMITRCESLSNPDYIRYGGRGITICTDWRNSFSKFLEDMGPRPSNKHSLDRIEVNGNYEASNCRWAIHKVQMRNTRRNRLYNIKGDRICLAEAVEKYGGIYSTVKWRLRQGQSIEEALQL